MNLNLNERASRIKLMITDVDGVLTDGRIILGNHGEELKAFHVHDGQGVKLAMEEGIIVAIITGRESEIVSLRAQELAIEDVYQGCHNKLGALLELQKKYSLKREEIAFIGDDINDLPAMEEVGLAITVHNGIAKVKEVAHLITKRKGGEGALREAIEYILKYRSLAERK